MKKVWNQLKTNLTKTIANMKRFRYYIILVFIMVFAINNSYVKCQALLGHSTINMDFSHYSQEDTIFTFSKYYCQITQKIQLSEKQDTIRLFLDVNKSNEAFFSIFFLNLKIRGFHNNSIKDLNYEVKNNTLIIPCRDTDSLILSYYYNSDYNLNCNKYSQLYFVPYQNTWHSVYFTNPNIIIDDIIIKYPDDIYVFLNKTNYSELSVFLLDSSYYSTHHIAEEPKTHLYLFKGCDKEKYEITNDWTDIQPDKKNNTIKRVPQDFSSVLSDMSAFFNENIGELNIIDANLDIYSDEDTARWGSAFIVDDSHSFIVMDTCFWSSHNWCHEVTHCYNRKKPLKTDSSFYFFNESMTEYLSIVFSARDKQKQDSIFLGKKNKYCEIKEKDDYQSIFQVSKNELGIDLGIAYGVVYVKTPYCIYLFAKSIGQKKFLELYSEFFQNISDKNYNLSDFKDFMLKHGVSKKKWNQFIKNLYLKDEFKD